ncbi:MAG: DUF1559 domain-containing protein [Pirellulales bacterium]|nr:DUF1559 domain-containing protein [Pirellulales bacterium]
MCAYHIPRGGEPRPARAPRAFTLVELLVVVVIIAMLMALLLPAVMGSKARARIIQCSNNQGQLAKAVLSYETAKKHLPGYANRVGPNGNIVGWAPVLLPFLGRNDLWEGNYSTTPQIPGWRSGVAVTGEQGNSPYIDFLVCPADVTATGLPQLSYVVNCGLYTDMSSYAYPNYLFIRSEPGVFRNYGGGSTGAISMSDVDSHSQTVLLSERLDPARRWCMYRDPTNPNTPMPTYEPTALPTQVNVGFLWPDSTSTISPELSATLIGKDLARSGGGTPLAAPLPAIHPGVVVVAFCDGHVEEISEEAPCSLYRGSVD